MFTTLYTPMRLDDFYSNLSTIRNELCSITNRYVKWWEANVADSPLACNENIQELDSFQSELPIDDYTPAEYDELCTRIESLQTEFLNLREDICIASLDDHDWWFNCLGSESEYLTERLLNNVPLDFIEKNPYTLAADISVSDLIAGYTKAKSTHFEYVLALAAMARKGSPAAKEFLLTELHIEVIPA